MSIIDKIKKFISTFKNKNLLFDDYKENFIYFVCGSESLPLPLPQDEELIFLNNLKTDKREEAISKLIEHNLRLVIYIAHKFENTGVDNDDLISIGSIGLIKAVKSYDVDKNIKLATYASRCIENEILMHLRKIIKQKSEVSLDEPLNVDYDGNELLLADLLVADSDGVTQKIENDEEKRQLWKAINNLGETEQNIMEMRFGLNGKKEFTQKEVADQLGISQSYISRLEKKIFGKLKKDMQKYN